MTIDKRHVVWYNGINKGKGDDRMVALQYTLFCTTGQYKPVSCIIKVDDIKHFNTHQEEYKIKAIEKICVQRRWSSKDLTKYHYTKIKCRKYKKGLDR